MNIPVLNETNVSNTNALPAPQRPTSSPVTQALGQVGEAVQGVGSELMNFAHQEYVKANSAVVMGRVAELNKQRINLMNDPKSGLLIKQGEQAANITPTGMDAFSKLHDSLRVGLNPEQLRLFNEHTASQPGEVQLQLMRHEAEQGKVVQRGNAKSLVDSDRQVLSTLWPDPVAFDKQLDKNKAHILDALHIDGFSADSDRARDEIKKEAADAWVGMIQATMEKNPEQAKHLFEVHQDELEPHQRIAIGQRVKSTADKVLALTESTQINSNLGPQALLVADTDGSKYHGNVKLAPFDLQGMMAEVRKKHSDNPELVDHIESNLVRMKQEHTEAAKEQRETNTDYAYGALAEGRPASEVYASRQYQELSGKDKKSIQDYVKAQKHEAERNSREARSERRASRMEARLAEQDEYELFLGTHSPDEIMHMSNADIQHKVGKLGTTNMTKLLNLKKQYGSNEKKLATDKAEELGLKEEMVTAGYDWAFSSSKDADQKRTYGKALDRVTTAIREEGQATGREVTPERKKEIYKEQLLKVHMAKQGILGTGIGSSVERSLFETDPYNVEVEGANQEDVAMAVSILSNKGIKHPSYEVIQNAVRMLKK